MGSSRERETVHDGDYDNREMRGGGGGGSMCNLKSS